MSKLPIVHVDMPAAQVHVASSDAAPETGFFAPQGSGYMPLEVPGSEAAQLAMGEEEARGSIRIYLAEGDSDEAATQEDPAIIPRTHIPGIGWFAVLPGAQGNYLALWLEAT